MDPTDLAELALSLPEIDPEQPSIARVYDYWLGGSQNFAADREVGRRTAEAMPHLPAAARANRAFLGRVVHHLVADLGITQLLDLGSGVPTAHNVHQVAQAANRDARVVYADIDPVAIAHARALLDDVPNTDAILVDLRRPDTVLAHPILRATLDFTQPIAVLMFAVLHFVPDEEDPSGILHQFMDATVAGSYLGLSHGVPDRDDPGTQSSAAKAYGARTGIPFVSRSPEQIGAWLTDLQIQPPGLVPIDDWMPDPQAASRPNPLYYGVLARK